MKGYTLIEVLVGLAIIGLLFTVGYAGYRDFAKRQVLNNTYEELKTNLNFARQTALSGEKPSTCLGGSLLGAEVIFASNGRSYSIYAKCPSGSAGLRTGIAFPTGITVSGPTRILFNTLGKGTDLTGNAQVILTHTDGATRTVTVTQQGTIK